MRRMNWIVLAAMGLVPVLAQAQPMRQFPGARPFLAKQAPQQPNPNTRVRPAPSQIGLESTDFYPKRGYPKQLGDFIEAGSPMAGGISTAGAGGSVAGNNGNTGVQSAGSMGFQGNTGNQIGQNAGGTIFGSLFGGGQGGGAGGFAFNANTGNGQASNGITGGGFSGMVPKGFGFGGTPGLHQDWQQPLRGVSGR